MDHSQLRDRISRPASRIGGRVDVGLAAAASTWWQLSYTATATAPAAAGSARRWVHAAATSTTASAEWRLHSAATAARRWICAATPAPGRWLYARRLRPTCADGIHPRRDGLRGTSHRRAGDRLADLWHRRDRLLLHLPGHRSGPGGGDHGLHLPPAHRFEWRHTGRRRPRDRRLDPRSGGLFWQRGLASVLHSLVQPHDRHVTHPRRPAFCRVSSAPPG